MDWTPMRKELRAAADAAEAMAASDNVAAMLCDIAALMDASLARGGKIMVCGNGGSAAQAQHFAAELVGRFRYNRAPMAALALSTDTSVLTALGNDYGFDDVFARQVRALGRADDLLLCLTTSGLSENVLRALQAAQEMGICTVAMTASGASPRLRPWCVRVLVVPARDTARVQELHLIACHALCSELEQG